MSRCDLTRHVSHSSCIQTLVTIAMIPKHISDFITMRTLKKLVGQSAINSVLGLLWLSGPCLFFSESRFEDFPFMLVGLILWFYIFVFFPVLVVTLFCLVFEKAKPITTFLQNKKSFYSIILLLVAYCIFFPYFSHANDIFLAIFIILINLFSLRINLRTIPAKLATGR